MVCHDLANFGGHRHCSSRYVLVCHVIKEDHLNKGSGDYDLKVVHLPVKLAANRHCNNRYIIALVCHVI